MPKQDWMAGTSPAMTIVERYLSPAHLHHLFCPHPSPSEAVTSSGRVEYRRTAERTAAVSQCSALWEQGANGVDPGNIRVGNRRPYEATAGFLDPELKPWNTARREPYHYLRTTAGADASPGSHLSQPGGHWAVRRCYMTPLDT
jgi:hypothetical protein